MPQPRGCGRSPTRIPSLPAMWAGWAMIARTFSSLPMCVIVETPSRSSAQSSQKRSIGRFPSAAGGLGNGRAHEPAILLQLHARDRRAATSRPASRGARRSLFPRSRPRMRSRRSGRRSGRSRRRGRRPAPSPARRCAARSTPARYGYVSMRDVERPRRARVDHGQQLRRPALVHREAEVGVCVVERHAGAADDLDAVAVGLDRARGRSCGGGACSSHPSRA